MVSILRLVADGLFLGIRDRNGMAYATFSFQWISNDGMTDADIPNATGLYYTLTDADATKTIKLEVSYIDDGGNAETLTSRATTAVEARPNSSDIGAPTALITRPNVRGEDEGIVLEWNAPEGSVTGYQILRMERPSPSRWWEPLPFGCLPLWVVHVNDTGSDATTYTDTDVAEVAVYRYRVRAINSEGVGLQSDSPRAQQYFVSHGIGGPPGSPSRAPRNLASELVNDGVELTWDAPEGEVTGYQILRRRPALCEFGYRVYVENTNSTDTSWIDTDFEPYTLYEYHVRAVNDVGAGYLDTEISTTSSSRKRVGDGRPNSPATGVPSITGTVQVGETLTADTSAIADEDGLNGARFYYQWLSGENTELQGATSATYTLVPTDEGNTVKVQVTFTDDNINQEMLTSSATTEVAAASETTQVEVTPPEENSVPLAPTLVRARNSVRGEPEAVVVYWNAPPGTVTGYQILRSERPMLFFSRRMGFWVHYPNGCARE